MHSHPDQTVDQWLFKGGLRPTRQRVILAQRLIGDGQNRHVTAESLFAASNDRDDKVSLATVYNILEILKGKGMIGKIRIQFDKSCYELRTDMHHHFLCRKCKTIFDIDSLRCSALETKKADGHSIESLQGYFYGICKNCQNKL